MKKANFFSLYLFLSLNIFGQDQKPRYPIEISPVSIPGFPEFTIEAKIQENGRYDFTIKKNDQKEEFSLRPFSESDLKVRLDAIMAKFKPEEERAGAIFNKDLSTNIDQLTKSLFFSFKLGEIAVEENTLEPPAGEICFNRAITIYRFFETDKKEVKDSSERKISAQGISKKSEKKEVYQKTVDQLIKIRGDTLNKKDSLFIDIKTKLKSKKDTIENLQKEITKWENHKADTMTIIIGIRNELRILEDKIIESQNFIKYLIGFIEDNYGRTRFESFNTNEEIWINDNQIGNLDAWMETTEQGVQNEYLANRDSITRYKDLRFAANNILGTLSQDSSTFSAQKKLVDSLTLRRREFELKGDELYRLKNELDYYKELKQKIETNFNKINRLQSNSRILDARINDPQLSRLKEEIVQLQKDSITKKKDWQSAFNDMPALELQMEKVEIEFNEGFIENIIVVGYFSIHNLKSWGKANGNLESQRIKFQNRYPLGFSRKRDFELLDDQFLYTEFEGKTYCMPVKELIKIYIQKHEVGRRDFSPKNHVYIFDKNSDLCNVLYKEPTYRLFEAKIFSDLIGLNATTPNGLIQTEISRRINIRTERSYLPEKINRKIMYMGDTERKSSFMRWFQVSIVGLPYIEPNFAFTKLEEDNKYLPLYTYQDSFNRTQKFTSGINLRRFEKMNAGVNLSLVGLDAPNWKSSYFLNTGFNFARVPIQENVVAPDTVSKTRDVNTFTFSVEIPWEIKADERYGFTFSWKTSWYYLLDRSFKQSVSIPQTDGTIPVVTKDILFSTSKAINSFEIFAYFNPDPYKNNRGRFFARYRLNWAWPSYKHNFSQAQIGYSLFILSK